MSDTTTTTPTPVDQPQAARASADTAEVTEAPAPSPELGESGEKALKAERAARRAAEKAASEALAKVKSYEDAQKSESERLTEQLQALKAEAAMARAETLRLRVAAETGLPADLHEFLVGDDEEALRGKAQKLMAATAANNAEPDASRRPAPDPTQGAKQGAGVDQLTRADLAGKPPEWIEAQRVAGRLNDLLGIR